LPELSQRHAHEALVRELVQCRGITELLETAPITPEWASVSRFPGGRNHRLRRAASAGLRRFDV